MAGGSKGGLKKRLRQEKSKGEIADSVQNMLTAHGYRVDFVDDVPAVLAVILDQFAMAKRGPSLPDIDMSSFASDADMDDAGVVVDIPDQFPGEEEFASVVGDRSAPRRAPVPANPGGNGNGHQALQIEEDAPDLTAVQQQFEQRQKIALDRMASSPEIAARAAAPNSGVSGVLTTGTGQRSPSPKGKVGPSGYTPEQQRAIIGKVTGRVPKEPGMAPTPKLPR